jgi:hypothetical protein
MKINEVGKGVPDTAVWVAWFSAILWKNNEVERAVKQEQRIWHRIHCRREDGDSRCRGKIMKWVFVLKLPDNTKWEISVLLRKPVVHFVLWQNHLLNAKFQQLLDQ